MSIGYTQTRFPVKITTPLPSPLRVESLDGVESISQLFDFTVDLHAEADDLDFTAILGQPVHLTFDLSTGEQNYIHGIVREFRQHDSGTRYTRYSASIVPKLWLLTQAANCRIFQNKSVPDIVKEVLTEHGVTDVEDSLTAAYAAREYCVQYRETDFAFVSRLMESEGISYFFTHSDSAHTLVLADDSSAWPDGPSNLDVKATLSNWERPNALAKPEIEQHVVSGQFKSTDYNFTTPETDLLSAASAADTTLSVYTYPANRGVKSEVEALVAMRLSEIESTAKLLRGQTGDSSLRTGSKITLVNHPRADANSAWVVQSATHRANQDTYSNSFTAFPATTSFRPARQTPAPRIHGCQTAKVTGKQGEEIWTDEYGRVKVKFHWDTAAAADETTSCWVRVAQGWAGLAWGSFLLPRIGQEVVVSFLEGDPDQPLITGCVYNATNTVPYPLPADQTKSTLKSNSSKGGAGFNELRFEDKAGAEEFFMQAQKEMVITVLGNQRQTVQLNRSLAVAGNESHSVSGTRTVTVAQDETRTHNQNVKHKVDNDYSIEVGGNFSLQVTGDITIKTSGKLTIESTGNATIKSSASLTSESGASMTIKAGASLSTEASATITQKAGATQTVEASGPLTLKGAIVQIN